MNEIQLRKMLEQFYIEDVGDGDLSSQYVFPKTALGEMNIIAKANGIFCGKTIIETCGNIVDQSVTTVCKIEDGEAILDGDIIAEIYGPIQSLLAIERVMLNVIQRMSGIATATNEVAQMLKGTKTKVCDTRKTAPGLRMLDKYAVRMGGGANHRKGLYDAVMLKDNHIEFAGGITQAVQKVKGSIGHTVKIEVEIETLAQLKEAIEAQVDIIMFDNCTPEEITEWIQIVPDSIITEASGNITLERIASYAKAGVDFISLGYLTHSVKALDMSARVSVNRMDGVLNQ